MPALSLQKLKNTSILPVMFGLLKSVRYRDTFDDLAAKRFVAVDVELELATSGRQMNQCREQFKPQHNWGTSRDPVCMIFSC